MARYILQSGVDRITGSRMGGVFQKCGRVFAIRTRAVPVQKKSIAQSVVKNIFDSNVKRWKDLSAGNKTSFATQAPSFPRTDSLGNSYTLKGQVLQTSSNQSLVTSQQSVINTMIAPGSNPGLVPGALVIGNVSNSLFLVTAPDLVPANYMLQWSVSPVGVQGSSQAVASNLKFLRNDLPGEVPSSKNSLNLYKALFGDQQLTTGFVFYIRYEIIYLLNGQSVLSQEGFGVVAAV